MRENKNKYYENLADRLEMIVTMIRDNEEYYNIDFALNSLIDDLNEGRL